MQAWQLGADLQREGREVKADAAARLKSLHYFYSQQRCSR